MEFIKKHKKTAFNLGVVLLLFFVVFYSNAIWIRMNDRSFRGDGLWHYQNTLKHLQYIKEGRISDFLFPNDGSFYPNLIYQGAAMALYLTGNKPDVAVMVNSIFILILAVSVFFIGKELWNEQTGLLAAAASISIPIIQFNFRNFHIDVQNTAMTALCCLLILKSEHFSKPKYTVAFFASLALGSLIKWPVVFYVAGLAFISFWIMIKESEKNTKKQALILGLCLAAAVILPLIFRFFRRRQGPLNYGFTAYFIGIIPLVALIVYLLYNRSINNRINTFFTGTSLFFIMCWHFYYLKFWDLIYLYPKVAAQGPSKDVEGFFDNVGTYVLRFIQPEWLILPIIGVLYYLFIGIKNPKRNYYLAGALLPVFFFLYHSDRDARYLMPILPFIAPLSVFWMTRMKNGFVRYAAVAFLMLLTGLSVVGWTIPANSPVGNVLRQTSAKKYLNKHVHPKPERFSTETKRDIAFLIDRVEEISDNRIFVLILFYSGSYVDKVKFDGEDLQFHLLKKGYYFVNVSKQLGLGNNKKYYIHAAKNVSKRFKIVEDELISVLSGKDGRIYIISEKGALITLEKNRLEFEQLQFPSAVESAWMSPDYKIYVLLENGEVYKREAEIWHRHSETPRSINQITGIPGSGLYAAGFHGLVLKYRKGNWENIGPKTGIHFSSLWGSSDRNIYAVGESGTILHYNGTRWKKIYNPHPEHILSIHGFIQGPVFMGGNNGLVLKLENGVLNRIKTGTTMNINSTWGGSPDNIYFAGEEGAVLHLKKGVLKNIETGENGDYFDITGNDDGIFAVAEKGHILHIKQGEVKNKISTRRTFTPEIILVMRIIPPGKNTTARIPFIKQINKHYPYRNLFYSTEKMPGSGNLVEIFEIK